MVQIIGKPRIPKKCNHCEKELRGIIQVIWKACSSIDLWKGTPYNQADRVCEINYEIYQSIKLRKCNGYFLFKVFDGQLINTRIDCYD